MNRRLCCFVLLCTILESGSHAQSLLAKVSDLDNERSQVFVTASRSKPTYSSPTLKSTTQRFVCNAGYTQELCHDQIATLKKTLEPYPTAQLGEWTWVLIRSQDWKAITEPRGLDPATPAFTYLSKRETFIEEALVSPVPVRQRELLEKWNMGRLDLLDFAVRHELGHGLCNDESERNADHMAQLLRSGTTISCGGAEKIKHGK